MSMRVTRKVQEVLSQARISSPPVDVVQIAHARNLEVRSGPLPDDLSGFLIREHKRTVIGVNSLHPKTRQRFTIAHELGHYFMHPRENFVDRQLIFFRDMRSRMATDVREIEANQFAAELLMPEALLFRSVGKRMIDLEDEKAIAHLAKNFGVSTQALTFRLANLKLAQQP